MNYSVELVEELQFIGEIINEQECKHRRLWRPAVATHPRMQSDWVWAAGSAERDLYHETHCKLRSSAAVGTCDTSTPYSSPKGDWRIPYDVEESRSRFAKPREGDGDAYPTAALLRSLQWVSDGYVSPRDTTLIDVLLWEAAWLRRDAIRHNICISDAQYYELSAQQNLWCEILEFWAVRNNTFIHSVLCGFMTKHYEIRLSNEPLLYAIAPLLHSNSATFSMQ